MLALALSAASHAGQPAIDDLGKSWPNAPDVSASPAWHAYMFDRKDLRYIQINDAAGQMQVILAETEDDPYLALLPRGRAVNVRVLAPDSPPVHGTVVYRDKATEIIALDGSHEESVWVIRPLKPLPTVVGGMGTTLMCSSGCSGHIVNRSSP